MTITVETLQFEARDGRTLMGTLYVPAASNGRAVLISGALGAPRTRYDAYASHLAAAGFRVLCFDFRGVGGSRAVHAASDPATLRQWGEVDLPAALDCLAARAPGARLLAVGHAEGGQWLGLAPNLAQVRGVLSVASGDGGWQRARGLARVRAGWQAWVALPVATRLAERVRAGEGEVPAGVAREWARWRRHPAYFVDAAGRLLHLTFDTYRGPLLAYVIDDDRLAPREAVIALHRRYRAARVELREIAPHRGQRPIGRAGYFADENRALWPSGAAWLASA
ncbi:alpha/beta hydrolase family protein [Xylophilus sp.]|uniref:alpha/beta hydrolase family protein n=1 Tax=Xylophilus sp. TaxID=2653893 RepID=UPI0013BD1A16|nr:alpha/beta hydrolase [Xylophilus sp.]KAF1041393.1 MAG: hypothetical protein GAK38_04586 [Xylophilus sp.]